MAETTSTAKFDEDAAKILLLGGAEEINEGLSLIDREFGRALCGWIRHRFPGIPSADLGELWVDTLLGVFKMIKAGRFDADRPLVPLLVEIIWKRAADRVRRVQSSDRQLQAIADRLRETATGAAWNECAPSDRRKILEGIRNAIRPLPPKQKLVMEVWVDHYPDSESMEFLRCEVSKVTGVEETLAAVKRALQEARGKVREWLTDRGYQNLVN